MKPEIILLAQIYSHQHEWMHRILEMQALLYAHQQGIAAENHQEFASKVCADAAKNADVMLHMLLENLLSVFPDLRQGAETIEELLKRISLS